MTTDPAGRVIDLAADRPEGVAAAGAGLVVVTQSGRLMELTAGGAVRRLDVLPGPGRHVRISGDLALVPVEGKAELAVVDLTTGAVGDIPVGPAPHDVTPIPGGRALVGDEASGSVTVVDLASKTAVATLPAGLQPGGVAADGDLAAAIDVRGRYLYRFDVTAGRAARGTGRLAVGAGPTHVVDVGGGLVAVADALGHAVLLVSLPRLAVVARVALPAAPEGLAADIARARLWVTTPGDNMLREIDLRARRLVAAYPTVRQPNSAAVDPSTGDVDVVGATPDGTLEIVVPAPL